MRFRIAGPWFYRMRIPCEDTDLLKDDEGNPLLGRAIYKGKELLISRHVPPEERLDVLIHEVSEAWSFHVPPPRTEEERHNLQATIGAQFWRDFQEQGGEAALQKIQFSLSMPDPVPEKLDVSEEPEEMSRVAPLEWVQSVEVIATPSGRHAQCGGCACIIAGGSIISGKPRWDQTAGGKVIDRALFCPHCGHVQRWVEGTLLDGTPNGAVVVGPTFEVGRAVENFLRQHPEATGAVVT